MTHHRGMAWRGMAWRQAATDELRRGRTQLEAGYFPALRGAGGVGGRAAVEEAGSLRALDDVGPGASGGGGRGGGGLALAARAERAGGCGLGG